MCILLYICAVDNNDELSRDSQNYVSDSSRSATNVNNSNSATPTLSMMQHEGTYLQGTYYGRSGII